jgi:23S rRNA (cytosine1962-C5)-methyltransferase
MYKLIDSGDSKKIEQFGNLKIIRPSPFAVWQTDSKYKNDWDGANITFERKTDKEGNWLAKNLTDIKPFVIEHNNIKFELRFTSFGHLGIFPEQINEWIWIKDQITRLKSLNNQTPIKILNLFAYTGGSTFATINAGADEVVHVDSSKTVIEWAKVNSGLNNLTLKKIRYILDDANKFVEREVKRGSLYDGIILDPPTYGRGIKNEVFRVEDDLSPLLKNCTKLLKPKFFVSLASHTPGFTSHTLTNLLSRVIGSQYSNGKIEASEMFIKSESGSFLPSGFSSRIYRDII